MTVEDRLTTEYEAWLEKNPTVPKISADEAIFELSATPFPERSDELKAQIYWLHDFSNRWGCMRTAQDICAKWISKIGGGFHPDTRGASYIWVGEGADAGKPCLTADEITAYDADMTTLFKLPGDPYEFAVEAMEAAKAK